MKGAGVELFLQIEKGNPHDNKSSSWLYGKKLFDS